MRTFFVIFLAIFIVSCNSNTGNIADFRTGEFRTFLDDSDATSTAIRNDSIQIETYGGVRDTFYIKWNSNFEYELTHAHPKSKLDSTPFIVKITGIKDDSYTFIAHYKGSNYKQKGRAEKINQK